MSWYSVIIGFISSALLHYVIVASNLVPQGKTESNYFSNRARLQYALGLSDVDIAFVGSSITGRIPCSDSGRLMNLGFDGDSSARGLSTLKSGYFKHPTVCFVEVNRLYATSNLGKKIGISLTDKVAFFAPIFKSDNRPSSLIYRVLLSYRNLAPTVDVRKNNHMVTFEKPSSESYQKIHQIKLEKLQDTIELIESLKEKTRCILVFYPVGYSSTNWPGGSPEDGRVLASKLNLEFVDLHHCSLPFQLSFSDTTHLDERTAMLIRDCLIQSLRQ